jgi:RNA polymerase sigma-70 factor (ECF subfamily)
MKAMIHMPIPGYLLRAQLANGKGGLSYSAVLPRLRAEPARQEAVRHPPEDEDWLARVRRGDEDAARALVQRLYPTVIKSIRCHLPRRTSEEDLAQSIFVKIFRKLDQFSGLVPLEHWVSRIAINTCINQLKHETLRPELRMGDLSEEQQAIVQHLASTGDEVPSEQSNAAREILDTLMARLRPDERTVITLLHLEERTVEQISRSTGWSASLVKVKAFRARHKMRKLWKTLLRSERS